METLTGSLVSGSRMLISEFDAFAASTGSLDLQTSTATPSAGYAFQLSGSDSSSNAFAIGGVLNFSGGNLSASSIYDANDGGTVTLGKIFNSGSVSTPDSFGRVTINLNPSTGVKNLVLAGYIVDASRIQLVESSDAFLGSLGGTAFGQGTNTGLFSTSSVSGKSYVFSGLGADTNGALNIAGVITFQSNGSLTGNIAFNDLSVTTGSPPAVTGSYIVAPSGRITLTNVTDGNVFNPALSIQVYVDGNGNALEIGVDSTTDVHAGLAFLQNLTTPTFSGNYGLAANGFDVSNENFFSAVGPVAVSGGVLSGFTDYNIVAAGNTPPSTFPAANVPLFGTASGPLGILTGTIVGLNADTPANADAHVYFLIDSTRTVGMDVDQTSAGQLDLLYFEAAQ